MGRAMMLRSLPYNTRTMNALHFLTIAEAGCRLGGDLPRSNEPANAFFSNAIRSA